MVRRKTKSTKERTISKTKEGKEISEVSRGGLQTSYERPVDPVETQKRREQKSPTAKSDGRSRSKRASHRSQRRSRSIRPEGTQKSVRRPATH